MHHFISDTHFGHANVLRFDERPFASIEEHDERILQNINNSLNEGDTLWHLGDVAWNAKAFTSFLDGLRKDISIHFIEGNHDHRFPKKVPFLTTAYLKEGPGVWLSHYPHRDWPSSFHGSIHLYGHVHGKLPGLGRSMDVGVNCIGYQPISLEAVLERLLPLPCGGEAGRE